MKRSRSFTWVNNGWRPVDAPQFNAGDGLLTAHDTLEHFTNDTSFEAELLAFGATLFSRMAHDHRMVDVSSTDLAMFLRDEHGQVKAPNPRWNKPLPDADAEKRLRAFIALATVKLMVFGTHQLLDFSPKQLALALDRIETWVRLGWRLAARRYRGHTPREVELLFANLMQAINQDHEEHPPRQGDRLTLSFDPQSLQFALERSHPAARQAEVAA